MNSRITLYLMSYKGYYILQSILSEFDLLIIDKVISSRDIKVEKDYYDEIRDLSTSSGIQFFDRNDRFVVDTPYVIAISWRWLIQTKSKLIILHDSLLPRYRGYSPLVNCLINNENSVGVTAILANEEYDTGDIIEQRELKITYPIKIFEVIKNTTPLYYEIVKVLLDKILNGFRLNTKKQNEKEVSYSLWLDDDDYVINWGKDSYYIKRFIDAVGFPYLGASSYMGNRKVRIMEAEIFDDLKIENRAPGKVIFVKKGNPVVVCGKGLLLITKIIEESTGNIIFPIKKIRLRFR